MAFVRNNPDGAVVMFELGGGLVFALYPRSELAKDGCFREIGVEAGRV